MKSENVPSGADFDRSVVFVPVTTLDVATATRVVAIDLQEFNAGMDAGSSPDQARGERLAMESSNPSRGLHVVAAPLLTKRDMLDAFRALRETRTNRHEDEMVIDAIIDDTRRNSLTAAIKKS